MTKKNITIKVEWVAEDEAYVATSDDLIGLVIQEENVDDCCNIAREFAYDMIGEYQDNAREAVSIDFDIKDKAG